jgi:hypothetical protein
MTVDEAKSPQINVDLESYRAIKLLRDKAVKDGQEYFTWGDARLYVPYADHLLEYMHSELKRRGFF